MSAATERRHRTRPEERHPRVQFIAMDYVFLATRIVFGAFRAAVPSEVGSGWIGAELPARMSREPRGRG